MIEKIEGCTKGCVNLIQSLWTFLITVMVIFALSFASYAGQRTGDFWNYLVLFLNFIFFLVIYGISYFMSGIRLIPVSKGWIIAQAIFESNLESWDPSVKLGLSSLLSDGNRLVHNIESRIPKEKLEKFIYRYTHPEDDPEMQTRTSKLKQKLNHPLKLLFNWLVFTFLLLSLFGMIDFVKSKDFASNIGGDTIVATLGIVHGLGKRFNSSKEVLDIYLFRLLIEKFAQKHQIPL